MTPPVVVLTKSLTRHPQFKNVILQSLDADAIRRLRLTRVTFKIRQDIEFPGKVIPHLYFVEEGMASITTTFLDGSQVEVGMFGYESIIGTSALMGTRHSLNRVYTQIAGSGYQCDFQAAKTEFDRNGLFQQLALRNVQAHLVLAKQSAGCNAKHNVKRRLARWLLMCADRVHQDQFKMSQEFLADMLGNTRPVLTVAARQLKVEKLIEYRRGTIDILDRQGLESCACECYRVIKSYLEDHTAFDRVKTA